MSRGTAGRCSAVCCLRSTSSSRRTPPGCEFTETLDRLRDDVLGSVPAFQELTQVLREESARQLHRSLEDVSVELSLNDPWTSTERSSSWSTNAG